MDFLPENRFFPAYFSRAHSHVFLSEMDHIRVAVEGARFTLKSRVIVVVSAEVTAGAVCAMIARWRNAARCLKIGCCTACVSFADATPGQGGDCLLYTSDAADE